MFSFGGCANLQMKLIDQCFGVITFRNSRCLHQLIFRVCLCAKRSGTTDGNFTGDFETGSYVEIKNDVAADRVPSADLEPFPNLPGGSGGQGDQSIHRL